MYVLGVYTKSYLNLKSVILFVHAPKLGCEAVITLVWSRNCATSWIWQILNKLWKLKFHALNKRSEEEEFELVGNMFWKFTPPLSLIGRGRRLLRLRWCRTKLIYLSFKKSESIVNWWQRLEESGSVFRANQCSCDVIFIKQYNKIVIIWRPVDRIEEQM